MDVLPDGWWSPGTPVPANSHGRSSNPSQSTWPANPTPAVMAIDIPIGLPESGPRACDQATRARLGPRRSSVFPAPIRAVLAARSQQEASVIGRGVDGRGISCQCWNIMPKIREIDDLLRQRPDLQAHIREVHPELGFCALSGRPLSHPKRTRAGSEEHLALVETVYAQETIRFAISDCRPRGAKADDVLDALAALWSAGRASQRGGRGIAAPCREGPTRSLHADNGVTGQPVVTPLHVATVTTHRHLGTYAVHSCNESPVVEFRKMTVITRDLIRHFRQHFALDWHGIHGAPHWARVRANGLRLAQKTRARTDVIELFSFLHDSCRLDERPPCSRLHRRPVPRLHPRRR